MLLQVISVPELWWLPWWVFCNNILPFWWWKCLCSLELWRPPWRVFCTNIWPFWWCKYFLMESWPWLCTHEFASFVNMWKTICSLYYRISIFQLIPFYTWAVRHFTLSKYCFNWLWDCKIKPFMSLHSGVWLHQACFS